MEPSGHADRDGEETATLAAGASSIELGKVKHALAVKMEHSEAHYRVGGLLGKGSFGEVHEAVDTLLGREVAVKSLKEAYRDHGEVVDRFLKEARGTAQLEHPNIMPVHEMGVDDARGIYFTMKKVEGDNLKQILDRLEEGSSFYLAKYPPNTLLEIFLSVCNGVAFAHSKGAIHRDLKPSNVMIGEYGEVLILDWGLVKRLDGREADPGGGIQLGMEEFGPGTGTVEGAVSGTPNYMAPEQAEGRIADVNVQSDVYSLGAILYNILTHRPPFEKARMGALLDNVKKGNFLPPRKRCPERGIPREMEAVCLKAMALSPLNRYRSVETLAADVRNFIGHREVSAYRAPRLARFWKSCRRNPVKASVAAAALAGLGLASGAQWAMLYGSYRSNLRNAEALRIEADRLVDEAKGEIDRVAAPAPGEALLLKDHSSGLAQADAGRRFNDIARLYNLAQGYYEGIPERFRRRRPARKGFEEVMRQRIEFALYREEYALARQWVDTVQQMIDRWGGTPSPATVAYLGLKRAQIEGKGVLSVTAPESVLEVMVWPLVEDGPRLVPGDPIARRRPPIRLDGIPQGSYLMTVVRGDGAHMPYPVRVGHGEARQVDLEIPDRIPDGMAFVPGGPFIVGGEWSPFHPRQTWTLPAFFIKRHEVTFAEYLEFWTSLDDPALKSACMALVRFDRSERAYKEAWDAHGNMADGRLGPELPVVGVTREAAMAFCAWKSRQLGETIRLPTAEEWEKAARGVDGRTYAWGNGLDAGANLALTEGNARAKARFPLFAPPGSISRDVSVYNVFDMAGNVREMTSSRLPDSNVLYQIKGGSASTPAKFLPCCYSSDTPVVPTDVGFRYLQEIPADRLARALPGASPLPE